MKSLSRKVYETLAPLWDFRNIVICAVFLGLGYRVDPVATEGVVLFCLFVPPIWSASLVVAKILRPDVRASELIERARETPMGAAIVYAANQAVMAAIALSFLLWWTR